MPRIDAAMDCDPAYRARNKDWRRRAKAALKAELVDSYGSRAREIAYREEVRPDGVVVVYATGERRIG